MYTAHHSSFGKYERLEIQDDATGNSFSLVPEQGAVLLDVQFNKVSVLDGYKSGEKLEIAKWSKSRLLIPFPNRLEDGTYHWNGNDYHFPIKEQERKVSVHGFKLHELPFEVAAIACGEAAASVTCRYRSEGEHPSYPFPFIFDVVYEIFPSHFDLTFSFQNNGTIAIPIGLGWHPYFKMAETSNEMQLQLPPCERIELNARALPTGERTAFSDFEQLTTLGTTELDTCFALTAEQEFTKTATAIHTLPSSEPKRIAEFFLKGSDNTLRIWQETGAGKFNFFQVFTPIHRKSLAIEPMTCTINAFNNQEGLAIVEPEATLVVRCGFELVV